MFHPHANVARLYLKRCEGERGFISAKYFVLSECNGLWDYLEISKELMFLKKAFKEDFMMDKQGKKEYDRGTKERNETNWKKENLQGKSPKPIANFAGSVSCHWLRSGYVRRAHTKVIITAVHDPALKTNWIKANIDGADCSPLCRVYHSVDELSMHVAHRRVQLAK